VSQCTADGNGGDGIIVTTECRVTGNQTHFNTSVVFSSGIHVIGTKNYVVDNTATSNDRGFTLDSDGNFQARNVAGNNSVNYFGSTNQIRGPILSNLNDPATSTQPWANFQF
jgi:parallel beta-helix repeat protein